MLGKVPLWNAAVAIYSSHQSTLLTWQDQRGANVNDLLALAYVQRQQQALPEHWWADETLQRIRALVVRVRAVRIKVKQTPQYPAAKQLELGLEGLDMLRLQQLIESQDPACSTKAANQVSINTQAYARQIGVSIDELNSLLGALAQ